MTKEIIILQESGLPLFHYSATGTRDVNEIVAAFLSAISAYVQTVGKDEITVLTFAQNKFVWRRKGDLYFIALVSQEDSAEIYRAILYDLSEQFVSMFYSELKKESINYKVFRRFSDSIEATLQRFDGVPRLARRYKTGLLPSKDFSRLKQNLAEIEISPDILRGSLLTIDGFVIVSNLRAYELDAALEFLESSIKDTYSVGENLIVCDPSLDPGSSLFFIHHENEIVSSFVIIEGRDNDKYLESIDPFVRIVEQIDFSAMKRVHPTRIEGPIGFFDHDIVMSIKPVREIMDNASILFGGMHESMQKHVIAIMKLIGDDITVSEINEKSGLLRGQLDEALAHLIAKGLVKIARLYPILNERSERFSAYLEVIGIPKRDYDVLDSVWEYCTGELSLYEISEKTEIPVPRILYVLRSLGNQVKWVKKSGVMG